MFIFFNKDNIKKRWRGVLNATALIALLGAITCIESAHILKSAFLGDAADTVTAAADGNWGLSFQQEGTAPIGNATPEELAEYNAYFVGNFEDHKAGAEAEGAAASEKVIYLTFDAGYENGYTESILDTLKKHNAPACFFLVGNYLETSPDIVKRMVAEGHTVGNHTMHHPDMSAIGTEEAFKEELTSLEDMYKEITGEEMLKIYRPPQGKYSESNLQIAKDMGYKTIFWSLAYVDWYESKQPTHEEAFDKLLPRIHPGAIVLLHSTSKTNAEFLDELLTKWEDMGYTFCSIEEL